MCVCKMYIHLHVSSCVRVHKIICAYIIYSFINTCMNRMGEGIELVMYFVCVSKQKEKRERKNNACIYMYDTLTGTLFFPFFEGMSSHETEQEFFLSLSLSLSSWFSPLPPEFNLVIDLGE